MLCCFSLDLHQLCKIRESELNLIVHKCVFSLISVHLHLIDSVLHNDTAEQMKKMQLPHEAETVIEKSVILHLDNAAAHVHELISLNTVKIMLQDHQLTVIDELQQITDVVADLHSAVDVNISGQNSDEEDH